jgi:hypothetical protein
VGSARVIKPHEKDRGEDYYCPGARMALGLIGGTR